MMMNTDDLTALLNEATDGLEPRASFTDSVLRGGRRRRLRHRVAVATSAATAAIVVVSGGTYVIVSDSGPPMSVVAGWLDQPTRGDLAGDANFQQEVLTAWEEGKLRSPNRSAGIFADMRGAPTVYWAGNTPSGRAAVVMQQAFLHPHDELPESAANTLQTLVGLVGLDPADGRLKLLTDQFTVKPTDPAPGYFQFGRKNRTLLVVERDVPVFEIHKYRVKGQTTVASSPGQGMSVSGGTFTPIPTQLSFRDGVAVHQLDKDFEQPTRVVQGVDATKDPVDLPILLASDYLNAAATGGTGPVHDGLGNLPWRVEWQVGTSGGPQVDVAKTFYDAVSVGSNGGGDSQWHIRAGLADGRVAIVGNYTRGWTGGNPGRIHAVLVSPDGSTSLLDGEVVNKSSVLPVKMRLPDAQGWVVANQGKTLKYRTSADGPWQDAGTDAALLPDAATHVLVNDKVVALPR